MKEDFIKSTELWLAKAKDISKRKRLKMDTMEKEVNGAVEHILNIMKITDKKLDIINQHMHTLIIQ